MGSGPDEIGKLRLERDLFLRLLELGSREDLRPFLADALALIVEVAGARKGYLELHGSFWIAQGLPDAELAAVRREISTGIVAEALATGRTVNTASAVDDPRFAGQASVQAQRIRAVLCAPVGIAPAMGVLYLQGRDAPGPFGEEDRARVELFARHLAPLADRLLVRQESQGAVDHTAEARSRITARGIAGTSRALAQVLRQLIVAAPVTIPVLITGESGTGKTAIARALHDGSPRARGPFVEVNCAALPETLFESELFGAEKGAHSTATRRIEGKVDAARGGTLLLDEVAEIPLAMQSKLLMFLQSRRYYRLGDSTPIEADVRIVAATNADLAESVRAKRFREDLYYRLNVLEVRVPPLRDRPEDIGPIADAIAGALAATHGGQGPSSLSRAARVALAEAEWPGNVRQLENALSRGWATALAEGAALIEPVHLFPTRTEPEAAEPQTYQEAMRRHQARLLGEALDACGWNVSEAARKLALSRSHLNDLIRAHGLSRSGE
ncbi:MAG: sigma-54-dependent Fis family transcriptional regulator [Deltaproteobacteria bacterium]|nr:sigma-54-dependent Fis family transcriptional regulator [Deltaproteobacteria bacterium]